jgi:hypothetical protein
MLDILAITGPIYLTIALGYFLTRRGLFARADMRVLGQFVINLALPALLFNALAQRKLADILNGRYLLVYALGSLAAMGLGLLWARRGARQDPTTSVFWAMGMSCPNSGFVGFPIALLVIGPVAGVMLGLNMIVENLLLIPLLLALAESSTGSGGRWHTVLRQSLLNLARNPMVLGLLAGFVVSALQWQMPSPLARTVTMFAQASAALSLFRDRWLAGRPAHRGVAPARGADRHRQIAGAPGGDAGRAAAVRGPRHGADGPEAAHRRGADGRQPDVRDLPHPGAEAWPRRPGRGRLAGHDGRLLLHHQRAALGVSAGAGLGRVGCDLFDPGGFRAQATVQESLRHFSLHQGTSS